MKIFGIYGGYLNHDPGVCLIEDGKIVFSWNEERPRRIKPSKIDDLQKMKSVVEGIWPNDGGYGDGESYDELSEMADWGFPYRSIEIIKQRYKLDFNEVDYFAITSPVPIEMKDFFSEYNIPLSKLIINNHHVSHCAGAYYTSGFKEDTFVFSYDAGGLTDDLGIEATYGKTFIGSKNKMKEINRFPMGQTNTIPCGYGYITAWLGWTPNKDEGKVTGLAGHGEYDEVLYNAFTKLSSYDRQLMRFSNKYGFFGATTSGEGIRMLMTELHNNGHNLSHWFETQKQNRPDISDEVLTKHKNDLAYNYQLYMEDQIIEYLNHLHELYPEIRKMCVAGGLFGNVKLNQRINELDWLDEMYVYPAMNDAGLGLGSALKVAADKGVWKTKKFKNLFLGYEYTKKETDDFFFKSPSNDFSNMIRFDLDNDYVAQKLHDGKIVGYFKGRFEFGPRALGARSILVRPTDAETHATLNRRLGRTEIMPFAPIVIDTEANKVFHTNNKSHYTAEFMTICYNTRKEWIPRIPAVVHEVDSTARPQIVKKDNPFYPVITRYHKLSDIPVLLNTSFNIHGEPIIESPEQALVHLKNGVVDLLVIDDYMYEVGNE